MEDKTVIHRIDIDKLRKEPDKKLTLLVLSGNSAGKMFVIEPREMTIGRDDECDIIINDNGISRIHAKIVSVADQTILIDNNSTNGTFVEGKQIKSQVLADGDRIRMGTGTTLKFSLQDSIEESYQKRLYESATRDTLTRAYNKKFFSERIIEEFSYSLRHNTFLSFVIMDIDHFKSINDTYGHQAGDFVLKTLSEIIHKMIRNEDIFCRYGGEEFVVILRGIQEQGAFLFCERVRKRIESSPFVYHETNIAVTLSLGYSTLYNKNFNSFDELIRKADESLYQAKRSGRNQTRPSIIQVL